MEEQDLWNEIKQESKLKRWKNRDDSLRVLRQHGIQYEILNEDIAHYRVKGVSFWPTTGKYFDPKSAMSGRGVFNLIRFLKARTK